MSRRLIVTADDFGMSREVNEAVEEAHRRGLLTCASLVVAGDAAADAFRRARRMPGLGVGLHLALYGAPAAAPEDAPDLLAPDGGLGTSPELTGARIALSPRLRGQVRAEVAAQYRGFAREGLPLDHMDGHWHCHQHPAILEIALDEGGDHGLRAVRVPYESPRPGWRAAGGRGLGRRLLDAAAHRPLAALMRRKLARRGLARNDWFFGKHDGGAIGLSWLVKLIGLLPRGVSEVGLHPASAPWAGPHAPPAHWRTRDELDALLDPAVREACVRSGVEPVRFADLRP